MKKSARNRIIIWSIVSVLLIAVLTGGIIGLKGAGSFNFSFFGISGIPADRVDKVVTGSADFDAEKINSLDIKWTSGSVTIKNSKSDKVEISEEASFDKDSENAMCWYLSNDGTLEIYSNKKPFSFFRLFSFGADINKRLTVLLPEKLSLDNVKINGASADVSSCEIKAEKLDIETASGTISIDGFYGSEADLNSVSGNIELRSATADDLDIETVSGSCKTDGNIKSVDAHSVSGEINLGVGKDNRDIKAETVSGRVEIKTDCGESGFTANYSSVSGDFDCDLVGRNKDGKFIYGNGEADYNISTVSGSIKIYN